MNKIAQKMLQHKKGIVALFAVLAVLCALLSRKVKVDYNLGPVDKCQKTAETRSGPGRIGNMQIEKDGACHPFKV